MYHKQFFNFGVKKCPYAPHTILKKMPICMTILFHLSFVTLMLGSIRAQQDETGSCPKDIMKGVQLTKKSF